MLLWRKVKYRLNKGWKSQFTESIGSCLTWWVNQINKLNLVLVSCVINSQTILMSLSVCRSYLIFSSKDLTLPSTRESLKPVSPLTTALAMATITQLKNLLSLWVSRVSSLRTSKSLRKPCMKLWKRSQKMVLKKDSLKPLFIKLNSMPREPKITGVLQSFPIWFPTPFMEETL